MEVVPGPGFRAGGGFPITATMHELVAARSYALRSIDGSVVELKEKAFTLLSV